MNKYEWLNEYLLKKPGATSDFKEEWGWQRYMVGGKMFAATMKPSEKHAHAYAGKDLINLKCDPVKAEALRQSHTEVMPAFYMDKRRWNAVDLSGELSDDEIRQMCDESYSLIFEKLTKKVKAEIMGE